MAKTVPYEVLETAMKDLNLKMNELSEQFGMSSNFVSHCKHTGVAPKWVLLAIEALQRRRGNNKQVVYVLKALSRDKEIIEVLLTKFGVSFTEV